MQSTRSPIESSPQESPLFSQESYESHCTTPTTPDPDPSASEHRWSDVIPPKTALKFAVIWNSDSDLVAFSPIELENSDSRTEDELFFNSSPLSPSPSDAYSQVLSFGQSDYRTMPLPDNDIDKQSASTTMLSYFRENIGDSVFLDGNYSPPPTSTGSGPDTRRSKSKLRAFWARTQASSTLDGLDVYLRGPLLAQTHRFQHNRYESCFRNLDGEFEFDPRTPFAKEYYTRCGAGAEKDSKEEEEDGDIDMVTDEGFYEVQLAPRQTAMRHHRSTETLTTGAFISISNPNTNDDASEIWSTIEPPESPSYTYTTFTSRDQSPPLKRRLTKPRPEGMPAPPSEVLQRGVFSHQVSLSPPPPPRTHVAHPNSNPNPKDRFEHGLPGTNVTVQNSNSKTKAKTPLAMAKLASQTFLSRKKAAEGLRDQWICIEVSHEMRQFRQRFE
ncbi:hypothetical protein BDP27DRAFT_1329746 [Rhodocollybia butyracea]|uniref:Uncharacterized protein n=1 Tax=Rhodocollybia butyracea TaxID=206335 RepID=A0A9P5U4N5_9AGAR|nr:hypothetical protein BDP27DRAFT_1329746 [Rhodocollybia butyracea]